MASSATLYRAGRVVCLQPAGLGKNFESRCTVTAMEQQSPCRDNGWKLTRIAVEHPLFWYDTDPVTNQPIFCAYGGYYTVLDEGLQKLGIPVEYIVRRGHGLPEPDLSKLAGVQWRPRQIDVFSALLAYDGGVIVCATAFGKSFTIRQLARVYPTAKIVITVSSLDVAKTLYNELKDHISDLGFCGTGRQQPRRVTVSVINSLDRCDADANLVIVDECHCALAPSAMKRLNRFYRAKMFGLTASPTGRSDGGDGFMDAIFGPVLRNVSYQESVAVGNIVQIEARIYECAVGPDVSGIDDKNYVDTMGIIRNSHRNDLIVKAAKSLENELGVDAQILVMVDKIEHAYLLSRHLPDYTVVTGVLPADRRDELLQMGVIQSDTKLCSAKDRDLYRKQFESNQLKRVIATRVWEKGVDFRDLLGLIRADGMASPIASCQIPGRLSRLGKTTDKTHGILIDIMDTFSRNLMNRSKVRIRDYISNGWRIIRVPSA